MMITDNLRNRIYLSGLIASGDAVLCAVSGGADSVCLLHALSGMEGIRLVCAHFNHHLRGTESDTDAAFVEELCKKMNIEFRLGGGDVAAYVAKNGMGTEEAARKLRYEFLEKCAEENSCCKIATAHNAEDNAETVILNLTRGAGLNGLCGIPPVRGKIVRPLLSVTRAEIEAYLEENCLEHVEDSTNALDDYSRNRIRHQVIPVLRSVNSGAVELISETCATLREDEEYLSSLADKFLEEGLCGGAVSISRLLLLPGPVMMRALKKLCGRGAGKVHLESVRMLCMNRALHGSVDIPRMTVTKEFDSLYFGKKPEAEKVPLRELAPGDCYHVPEAGKTIKCEFIPNCAEIHNSLNTFCLKSGNIYGSLSFSSRLEGDKIRLAGRGCTKAVRKLYSEAELPLEERVRNIVIRDENGPLAVCGFGISERVLAGPGDDVIKIEIY